MGLSHVQPVVGSRMSGLGSILHPDSPQTPGTPEDPFMRVRAGDPSVINTSTSSDTNNVPSTKNQTPEAQLQFHSRNMISVGLQPGEVGAGSGRRGAGRGRVERALGLPGSSCAGCQTGLKSS